MRPIFKGRCRAPRSALRSSVRKRNGPRRARFAFQSGGVAYANHQRSAMRELSICQRLPIWPELASLVECAST